MIHIEQITAQELQKLENTIKSGKRANDMSHPLLILPALDRHDLPMCILFYTTAKEIWNK